jgi:hypothetical protein
MDPHYLIGIVVGLCGVAAGLVIRFMDVAE